MCASRRVLLLGVLVRLITVCRGGVVVIMGVLTGEMSSLRAVAEIVGNVEVLMVVDHATVLVDHPTSVFSDMPM